MERSLLPKFQVQNFFNNPCLININNVADASVESISSTGRKYDKMNSDEINFIDEDVGKYLLVIIYSSIYIPFLTIEFNSKNLFQ